MSSITPVVGQGAASTMPTQQQSNTNAGKAPAQTTSGQDVRQNLQAVAQAATGSLERDEKARTAQVPKRVEAPYSPQKNKKKAGRKPKEEDLDDAEENHAGLDLQA